MLSRQIKFWVFGVIGAVGIYLTLRGLGTDFYISIGLSLIVGAAAAVIKNPEITRRFWAGWSM